MRLCHLLLVWPKVAKSWSLWSLWQGCRLSGRADGDLLREDLWQHATPPRTAAASVPVPAMSPCRLRPPQVTLPTVAGSFVSVSSGVTAPFPWVVVHVRLCLCPPRVESLFPPVLWKYYNQSPVAFKVRFPGDSQPLYQIPRLGSLMWGSELSQQ